MLPEWGRFKICLPFVSSMAHYSHSAKTNAHPDENTNWHGSGGKANSHTNKETGGKN